MSGWFSEVSSEFPGQAFSLKVNQILYEGQSDFQKISIFERSVVRSPLSFTYILLVGVLFPSMFSVKASVVFSCLMAVFN